MLKCSLSLLILGLVCHLMVAEAQEICGPNAEFRTCASSCPINCTNMGTIITCTKDCAQRCTCKTGFVENSEGTCIPPSEC